MKNQIKFILFIAIVSAICACTKDRSFTTPAAVNGPGGRDSIVAGTLVVNEFEAKGSQFDNDLTLGSDWFEIYNTTNDTITLKAGRWFVTDSLADNEKYELPLSVINPKGFLTVWCDSRDTVTATAIHTSFGLSSSGEQIGLFYKQDNDTLLEVNNYTFGAQQSAISFGRLPDGSANWSSFNAPTPGASNH